MGAYLTKKSKAQIIKDSYTNKFKAELLTKMKKQAQDTKALNAPKLQLDANTSYVRRIKAKNMEQKLCFPDELISSVC